MSKKSQDKRKARSKEKAKTARRAGGVSPLARLAPGEEGIECWVLYVPEDDRTQDINVFRRVRGGGAVAAYFLIDFECIGLKDAFYDLKASPSEILGMMRKNSREQGMKLERMSPEEARRRVAGAMRWTREQHFRMPADTERALKILGGELDVEHADVSDFGVPGGGLHYVGMRGDLKNRLTEETVEEFLVREDVTATFMDEDLEEDLEEWEEEEEELSEEEEAREDHLQRLVTAGARAIVKGIEKRCRKKKAKPPEELMMAARIQAVALFAGAARAVERGNQDVNAEIAAMVHTLFEEVEERAPGKLAAVRAAFEQVKAYVEEIGPGKDLPGFHEELAELELETEEIGEALEALGEDEEDEADAEEEVMTEMEGSEALAQQRARTAGRLVDGVRRWCFATGKPAHPRLEEATKLIVDSVGQAFGETDAEMAKSGEEGIQRLLSLESEESRTELVSALAQVREFMSGFASGEEMAESLGIETPREEEEEG